MPKPGFNINWNMDIMIERDGPYEIHDGEKYLFHEGLAIVKEMREAGRFADAEEILMNAVPSPAVANELRMIKSKRAWEAKKSGDWASIVRHVTAYNDYAELVHDACIASVNQAPPGHTPKDIRLLAFAVQMISRTDED